VEDHICSSDQSVQYFLKDLIQSYLNRNKQYPVYDIKNVDELVSKIHSVLTCPVCTRSIKVNPYRDYVVKYKKLEEGAKVPMFQHSNDAGADLYALTTIDLHPDENTEVHTGIALDMPDCIYATIEGRSSFNGRGISTYRGIIDPGYRGEISAFMKNSSNEIITISRWQRFAQLIFHYRLDIRFAVVNELSKSERGTNRWGSTG